MSASTATVTTEFRAEAGSILRAQEKIIAGYEKTLAELRKQVRASGAANNAAKRHGRASQSIFQQMGWTLKGAVIGPLAAFAAPMGVLAMIKMGYQGQLDLIRQIATETRKAAGETTAFLALQEAGEKAPRLNEALRLAERYGIRDRGQAMDTIQAMQSVWGSFEKGMEAAQTIFAASRVGIDVETAKTLEVMGQGKGLAPGQAIRMAHIAGEASGWTPEVIASVAPSLSFYQDPALAFALAGGISSMTPAGELSTYTKAAGRGLLSTSALKDWYTEHGVGEGATQFDRLRALKAAGIDTVEELDRLGMRNIREQKAIVDAVNMLDKIEQIYASFEEKARPGLFAEELRQTEAEVPWQRYAREADMMQTMGENAMVGEHGNLWVDEQRLREGTTYRLAGMNQGLFGSVTDETGRSTLTGVLGRLLLSSALNPVNDLLKLVLAHHELNRRLEESDPANSAPAQLNRANQLLESIDGKLTPTPGRGPLTRPGKDR